MRVTAKHLDFATAAVRPPQDGPVEVFVPVRTIGGNSREHWAAKAARVKRERAATAWALVRHARVRLPVRVTFTRYSAGTLDKDENLPMACKAIKDELSRWLDLPLGAGGHHDDSDSRVTWLYLQEKTRRRTKARPAEPIGVRVLVEFDVVADVGEVF